MNERKADLSDRDRHITLTKLLAEKFLTTKWARKTILNKRRQKSFVTQLKIRGTKFQDAKLLFFVPLFWRDQIITSI